MNRVVRAARADLRIGEAMTWLAARPLDEELVIVGATQQAASELIRGVAEVRGAGFGWHRTTLARLATALALPALTGRGLAPAGNLPIEAMCARVLARLREEGRAGRLGLRTDQPGMARALARTLGELRMARLRRGDDLPPGFEELSAALDGFARELAETRLADRALTFEIAAEVAAGAVPHAMLGHPLLLVDVPLRTAVDQDLVAALARRSPAILATVPAGDERTVRHLRAALGIAELEELPIDEARIAEVALPRVQAHLFAPEGAARELDASVAIFSAPGESRECVEIARRLVREASTGVPFDRMAVLLRTPAQYRVHLQEALGRAGVPAHFEQGTLLPDPSGRAFLALLACATEGLSARRFAEYLSLGEVPDATGEGAPPAAPFSGDRWVPPDEDLVPPMLAEADVDPSEPLVTFAVPGAPVAGGSLRTPWRWERLLVEAAVIGGRERWRDRLDGLEARLRLEASEPEGTRSDRAAMRERLLADLGHLRAFALPLLDDLAALPAGRAPWTVWLDRLTALATRALRRPERVLSTLAALAPMGALGASVALVEVQAALRPRMADIVVRPSTRRYGKVLIAPIEAARGMAFDVVFVPGLAERLFPQRISEDPLLLDARRTALGLGLETRDDRLAEERLALRLAIGAARRAAVLSYPRIDLEQGRPRVPSFYGLEVLHAAEGRLPGFDELGRRAGDVEGRIDGTAAARIGWPAPRAPTDAIDEAEYDLALLDELFALPGAAPVGAARYLVEANPHLARALRFRDRRWSRHWTYADGLVEADAARAMLAANTPAARPYSATALEHFAVCPYRFVLRAMVGLEPRTLPEPIETLGAVERGSLIHDVQFELLGELRDASLLPLHGAALDRAWELLDVVLGRVGARYREELYPAIARVWDDGLAAIRADLREWLRRMIEDDTWTPRRFELAFGPARRGARDPASIATPVPLPSGLTLRGSIDVVDQRADGALRATDHKTGAPRVLSSSVIAGGRSLQPVLYAAVLEQMFPGAQVAGGRLYHCTARGEYKEIAVPLEGAGREGLQLFVETLRSHFDRGFFPAAPAREACAQCDFRRICGPHEEARVNDRKPKKPDLVPLDRLRGHR